VKPKNTFVPEGFGHRIDAMMDLIRFGPELMNHVEFLALLFHAERSLGYGKPADAASLSQMAKGVYNRKTRQRIRGAAGIAKATCAKANARLEKKGLIRRVPKYRDNGGCAPTEYEIQWHQLNRHFVKLMPATDQPNHYPCPPHGQPLVHDIDSTPVHGTDTPCLRRGQQQRRSYRGDHHQIELIQPGVSGQVWGVVEQQNAAASFQKPAYGQHAAPETAKIPPQRKKSAFSVLSFKSENDEKPELPSRERLADPAQEFMTRLKERGHAEGTEPGHILRSVQKQLSRHGLTMEGFLHYENGKATGLSTNPAGMYTQLAKEWHVEREQYELERQRQLAREMNQGIRTEKPINDCPHCSKSPLGKGAVAGEDGAWLACICATPAVAAVIAKMEAQRRQKLSKV
jgi:hypothetical protein